MTEEDARAYLLVRAVEMEDGAEMLLTRDDRHDATAAALATAGPRDEADYLATRARLAVERLVARFPALSRAETAARWPALVGWALPLAAFAAGVASNELGGNRLNIIAFPLLGMLAWNLFAYLLLLFGALRRLGRRRYGTGANGLAQLLARLAEPKERRADGQPNLQRALRRFGKDWWNASAGLTYSRASRTLHLSAALLAAGALLGMYLRALGVEYRAGWESTFVEPATLHAVLQVVLGPASTLSGVALPDPQGLAALRWSRGPGANAGPWIHLYATTAALAIIGPRLVLALWHAVRAARLRRTLPLRFADDAYARRLLRSARGQGAIVRVLPYSFHPGENARDRLHRALVDVLGAGTRVTIDPPIAYGDEDRWLAEAGDRLDGTDYWIVLFNLSATPEAENQGAFVAGLRRMLRGGGGGGGGARAELAVLLDSAGYRRRLGSQGSGEMRLEGRRAAWAAVLRPHGAEPLLVDLDEDSPGELAQRLEGVVLHAPPARAGAA